ncbi:MAG: hypothetical protein JW760_00240 [Spirochaetales bacterium]|nr:hypothetical protein [Spirochaetales bacterium]
MEEFWAAMEGQIGEKILIKSLGQCFSGHPDIKKERWGVFFLTGCSFYFKTFEESSGFLEGLIRRKKANPRENKELLISIPLEVIRETAFPQPKSAFQKIFSRPDEKISFRYKDAGDEETPFIFSLVTGKEEFLKIFETLLP